VENLAAVHILKRKANLDEPVKNLTLRKAFLLAGFALYVEGEIPN